MINPNLFYVMKNTKYDRVEIRESFQKKIEKNGEKLKIAFSESRKKLIFEDEIKEFFDEGFEHSIYD